MYGFNHVASEDSLHSSYHNNSKAVASSEVPKENDVILALTAQYGADICAVFKQIRTGIFYPYGGGKNRQLGEEDKVFILLEI